MFVWTICTRSFRIGAVNTAGIDVEPDGWPVSALMTVTTGLAAAVVDMMRSVPLALIRGRAG